MRALLLSNLLHYANRTVQSENFYRIKNQILIRHGKIVGYDVQFIDGKKCYTCGGTGIYVGYNYSGYQFSDACRRCLGGWYRLPVWNVLAKLRFGKFTFHQPKKRCYSEMEVSEYLTENQGLAHSVFDGYIDHRRPPYGDWAVLILFLLYRRELPDGFGFGLGWRANWWRFDAQLNNALWFYRRRANYGIAGLYRRVAEIASNRFPKWIEV